MRQTILIISVLLLAGCGRKSGETEVETPRQLIEAMKARYDGQWYETLTFVQETIQYRGGEADTSIWYEAMALPGKLRIDIAPVDSGNGLLFADDRRYIFRADSLLFQRDEIHPLMVLGFDVYAQDPDVTRAKLDSLGFDLSILHEGEWDYRPAYVVGAPPGDLSTRQFWVDKENLYLVRIIQPDGPGGQNLVEIRFRDYEPLDGGWIAPTVEFYLDGRLAVLEHYNDIVAGPELSSSLFDPGSWATAEHWMDARAPGDAAGE